MGLGPFQGMVWGLTKAWPTTYSKVFSEEDAREGPTREGGVGHLLIHSLSLPPQGPTAIRTERQRFHRPVCQCDGDVCVTVWLVPVWLRPSDQCVTVNVVGV